MGKNILIINEYAGSPSYGMTFRHYYLAKEFIKKGYSTTIVSASFSHFLKKYPNMNGKVFQKEKVDGVDFIWIKVMEYKKSFDKRRALKWIEFTAKLFFLGKKLDYKPDVIICSTTELFAILPAYYLAKKYRAKLVYEVRDIWPLTLIKIGNFSEKNIFIQIMSWLERFSIKKSDILVSNLSNYSQHIKNLGINREAEWISNGIDLDEMQKIEPLGDEIEKLLPKNKFIVGYTGKLGVSNAITYLLKAARELKDDDAIAFVIVGEGQEKKSLMAYAADLDSVIFIDPVKKTQVQSMLELFDICYIGLQKEELFKFGISPNKLYEYMYSAKPVLQSIDIQDDIVQKAGCGICVEAQNPKAIYKAILEFYGMNQEQRVKMGKRGKNYVIENCTYQILANKYLSILNF